MQPIKTARVIALYLTVLFLMCALLWSCSTVRKQERQGCYAQKNFVGYNTGGYAHATKVSKRRNY